MGLINFEIEEQIVRQVRGGSRVQKLLSHSFCSCPLAKDTFQSSFSLSSRVCNIDKSVWLNHATCPFPCGSYGKLFSNSFTKWWRKRVGKPNLSRWVTCPLRFAIQLKTVVNPANTADRGVVGAKDSHIVSSSKSSEIQSTLGGVSPCSW